MHSSIISFQGQTLKYIVLILKIRKSTVSITLTITLYTYILLQTDYHHHHQSGGFSPAGFTLLWHRHQNVTVRMDAGSKTVAISIDLKFRKECPDMKPNMNYTTRTGLGKRKPEEVSSMQWKTPSHEDLWRNNRERLSAATKGCLSRQVLQCSLTC